MRKVSKMVRALGISTGLTVLGTLSLSLLACAPASPLVESDSQEIAAKGVPVGADGISVVEPTAPAQEIPTIITPASDKAAPEFRGIVQWINSSPLTLADLRGKVVLVDFWTYSCINCQHTLPYLIDWHAKYADTGLVIVGVHAPEFEFESVEANIREAAARQNVTWPVAMDNDFSTWRAYENRWWPHAFLIDQDGLIRYHHIGEGAYQETELHIRNLLTEAGYDVYDIPIGGVNAGAG